MKKLIAIFLIMLLSISVIGCGNGNDGNAEDNNAEVNNAEINDDNTEIDDSGEDIPQVIIPDGYAEIDDYDEGIEYELGAKAEKSFGLETTVEKQDNSSIATLGTTLESKLLDSIKKLSIGNYQVIFNEYEEYEGEVLDKHLYVAALEDNDSEKGQIEAGMYHDSTDGKYHQYVYYVSDSLYDINKESIKPILSKIEKAFGVSLNASKVEKALKEAISVAKDEEYASLYSKETIKGKNYTETITTSAEASMMEDENIVAYLYVDRDRIYN